MGNSQTTVLVTGATGQTGRRVVAGALQAGYRVRALVRNADRGAGQLGTEVEFFQADVRDPQSLAGVGNGVDVVIHTIGTRSYFGANGGAAVDHWGVQNLVAAITAGSDSPRFILMSAFGLGRRSWALSVFSKTLGDYFVHKASAELTVRSSGLPWTIVRPVELRNRPPRQGPFLNQSRPLSLARTVSRDIVADVLLACVERPCLAGKTFEVCERDAGPLPGQFEALLPDGEWRPPESTPIFRVGGGV